MTPAGQEHGQPALPASRDQDSLPRPNPRVRSADRCPAPGCGAQLDGGPILYHCQRCRRSVYAADLDREFAGAQR